MNPERNQGRAPCQFAAEGWPSGSGRSLYMQPNMRTALERAVPTGRTALWVADVIPDNPPVRVFSREDWDYLGRPECDELNLLCGPWGSIDGHCRCDPEYAVPDNYLENAPSGTGRHVDRSVCRKVGHKVVQVSIPMGQLSNCGTGSGCSAGDKAVGRVYCREYVKHAFWSAETGYVVTFEGERRTYDNVVAGCGSRDDYQFKTPASDWSEVDYQTIGNGNYEACGQTWSSTKRYGDTTGTLYQRYLDFIHGAPGAEDPRYDSGNAGCPNVWEFQEPAGTWPNLSGSYYVKDWAPDCSYYSETWWSCEVTYYEITNGAQNAELLSAVTAAVGKLNLWHLDSTYLTEHGQTPRDDAIYPWRPDGRFTVAPLIYDLIGCDGAHWPRTIGGPVLVGGEPWAPESDGYNFDWAHRRHKWEARTVCDNEQPIWVAYQYGRYVDGSMDATGVPLLAESFTDEVLACALYYGSSLSYGVTALVASSTVQEGTRGPTQVSAGGGIVAQKLAVLKTAVPSHSLFRPCGLDRLLMNEDGGVCEIAGEDGEALVSVADGVLQATIVGQFPAGGGQPTVVVYGVPMATGVWTFDSQTDLGGGKWRVTLRDPILYSDRRIPEAGALRGPATERADPDFGYGIIGLQRFPEAWPICGRTRIVGKRWDADAEMIELAVEDAGTLWVGDFVGAVETSGLGTQRWEVASCASNTQIRLVGLESDLDLFGEYLYNGFRLDAHDNAVYPPHWTWHDTRPKGTWWLCNVIGLGDGNPPGDWWGPECWVQPAAVNPLTLTVIEKCTPAACCGLAILDIPLPTNWQPWTCGSVAVNYPVEMVTDPLYQAPTQFTLIDEDTLEVLQQTWPEPDYCEPCLHPEALVNPSAPEERVSLPAGCAFVAPLPPRGQPDGAGFVEALDVRAPWTTPWKKFRGGKKI